MRNQEFTSLNKLEVIFLIHSLNGGGAERVTVNLATDWAAQGALVTIAMLGSNEQKTYDLVENVRLVPLAIAGKSRGIVLGIVTNFIRILRLRRFLSSENPDVIIGMMSTSAILLALSRNDTSLAIGSERNYPAAQPIGRVWSILRKFMYGRLDALTVQTEQGKEWLLENTNTKRVVVIPNSVQLPLDTNEPIVPVLNIVAKNRRVLLAVGRLEHQKAFCRLISAFERLHLDHPDWDLVILGEGSLRKDLEKQVVALGMSSKVRLPGWAGNLTDWYEHADAFAMTSLYEGFPNALIEAMAHGCAVLSVDCDTGPRDMIEHNYNGLLIPQNDASALIGAMAILMNDHDLRAALGTRAKAVCDDFSPSRINAKWLEVLSPAMRCNRVNS